MKLTTTAVLLGVLSLSFVMNKPDESRMIYIEHSAQNLTDVVRIDNARQQATEKVVRILARFNPALSSSLKLKIAGEIYEMSIKYPNLDVNLISATITHESARTWNPEIVSNAGAMGLMQIMPATGQMLAKYEGIDWTSAEDILFNPIYNIRLGARYLSALIETYDVDGGLAAYNGGLSIVEKWLRNNKADGILFKETREYVPFVLKWYDEFKDTTL
ncbi:MAG: lytic transglycosylase domain-containing protein [bacterium]